MIVWLKNMERKYRFAPRVDGRSLVLENGTDGGVQQATINSVSMKEGEVPYWSTTDRRFKTTNVSTYEIGLLNGVMPGVASPNKVVALDNNKNISGLNTVSASVLNVSGLSSLATTTINGLTVTGSLNVNTSATFSGQINGALFLATNTRINSFYNNSHRTVFERVGNVLRFGNTSENLSLSTASSAHVYHQKGNNAYKMWDENNDGSGSGLDADKLDGLHASQFLRSDTSVTLAGNLSLDGTRISFWNKGTYNHNEMWRVYNPSTAQNLYIYSPYTSKIALNIYSSGRLDVLGAIYSAGHLVMTTHNGGSGTNFDADKLDGLHASQFLRSDVSDTMIGLLYLSRGADEQLRVGYNVSKSPYISFYNGAGRKAYIQYATSGSKFVISNDALGTKIELGLDGLTYVVGSTRRKVWHDGNDGSGSGLDADKLDGVHLSDLWSVANSGVGIKLLWLGYMWNSSNASPNIKKLSGSKNINSCTRKSRGYYRFNHSFGTSRYLVLGIGRNGNFDQAHTKGVRSLYGGLSTYFDITTSDAEGTDDTNVFLIAFQY